MSTRDPPPPAALTARGEELLAPIRALAPALVDAVGILPSDRIGEIHAEPFGPLPIWDDGDFLDDIDDDYITAVLDSAGAGVQSAFANVETRILGGAIARDPALPSAIGGRRAGFSLLIIGVDIPGVTSEALRHDGPALIDAVSKYSHGEINFNWAGQPSVANWQRLWSPETAAKLAEVRATYDPDRRFAFGH